MIVVIQQPFTEATNLKKTVNDGNSHVHGLLQQPKLDLDLDEPINKDGTHVPSDLPSFQIPWSDSLISLGDTRNKKQEVKRFTRQRK